MSSTTHVARSSPNLKPGVYERLHQYLEESKKANNLNINRSILQKYQVKCTGIDFLTGNPEDGGLKALEPMSFNELVNMCDPNTLYTDDDISYPHLSPTPCVTAIDWTRTCEDAFDREVPNSNNKTMLELSSWERELFLPNVTHIDWRYHWALKYVLVPQDNSYSHFICGLANDYSFTDKIPLFGELYTCCVLDNTTSSDRRGNNEQRVAITLLSSSGRSCRIMQFLRDGNQPPTLRISPVYKLGIEDDDEEQNREVFIKFLCWALSKPLPLAHN
ncbi:hypothetical protein F4810DRAFT_190339 [Camillea tinctor]|nr:hypothetical protein F4810DRAFT_190339 [Camillea tinctor]